MSLMRMESWFIMNENKTDDEIYLKVKRRIRWVITKKEFNDRDIIIALEKEIDQYRDRIKNTIESSKKNNNNFVSGVDLAKGIDYIQTIYYIDGEITREEIIQYK